MQALKGLSWSSSYELLYLLHASFKSRCFGREVANQTAWAEWDDDDAFIQQSIHWQTLHLLDKNINGKVGSKDDSKIAKCGACKLEQYKPEAPEEDKDANALREEQ